MGEEWQRREHEGMTRWWGVLDGQAAALAEPDFKTMPAEEVAAYLAKTRIDTGGLLERVRKQLSEARALLTQR